MVKNSKSALLALAAAGGLWAWRNRDKIQGWMNSQGGPLSQLGQPGSSQPMTGETRRIGESDFVNRDTPTHMPSDTYRTEI